MSGHTISVPTWTPPRWVNAVVKVMLRTPGVQRLIGSTIALITVTGRRTGRRYTTPVSYDRQGASAIVLTKRFRTWWRNLERNPEIEVRLAGRTLRAHARASVGDEDELPTLVSFLEHRRRDAKAYGLTIGADGRVDEGQARELLPQIVVIRIPLDGSLHRYVGRKDGLRPPRTTAT